MTEEAPARHLDTLARATLAQFTGTLSPAALLLAWQDWRLHLAASPGKQIELVQLAMAQAQSLAGFYAQRLAAGAQRAEVPTPVQDRRFAAPGWRDWPFSLWHQAFLLSEQWWDAATHGVAGVSPHHEKLVAFWARQWLDMASPGNQLATNPVALKQTRDEHGLNLLRGAQRWLQDLQRLASHSPPEGTEAFRPGHEVAVTPGRVVLRNRVMELIQYQPSTPTVHAEPVLLVPAWIMKYYILDLSPHNSLVRHLVDHGHTVFCISWKNPGEAERDLGMDDYLDQGFFAALAAVQRIVPRTPVHAAGYCLGGTLLAIAAAAMARDGDDRLATTTFFAAQTDFSEPGELGLFIDDSQVSLLEAQMSETGYLDSRQMAGAFQMLRSYDLLWSRLVNSYLLGEAETLNDLMAWNADATRMPARMHSQYLRRLFLDDDLSEGRYPVGGRPVSLGSLRWPSFMVGTETDHVAPWRSVHKLHFLSPAEITFVLTSGGHNAGIVNPPVAGSHRHYRQLTRPADGAYLAPDEWQAAAMLHEGSWWPAWQQWLATHSGPQRKPPRLGLPGSADLGAAPGHYVMER